MCQEVARRLITLFTKTDDNLVLCECGNQSQEEIAFCQFKNLPTLGNGNFSFLSLRVFSFTWVIRS